jgi:hypothetical protein
MKNQLGIELNKTAAVVATGPVGRLRDVKGPPKQNFHRPVTTTFSEIALGPAKESLSSLCRLPAAEKYHQGRNATTPGSVLSADGETISRHSEA